MTKRRSTEDREESNEIRPYTDEEIEEIRGAKWAGFHDPLCGENIGDGPCGCKVRIVLRFLATVDALRIGNALYTGPKECPWCKGPLQIYHSGVMCSACMRYYEKDKWITVGCDEAHTHGKKCMVEVEPPAKP